ncbi:MAG: pyruvate dehydrogenase (acetyl-transferring) E1 component subunit alpha [bacterium]
MSLWQSTARSETEEISDEPQNLDEERQQELLDEIGQERITEMYKKMVLIRLFEERTYQVYLKRKIGGFCHIYSGEEAVAVGTFDHLDMNNDYAISAYREHGHALAAGMTPKSVMAELYGKATGCSRGKGGSMHLFNTDINFMGGHAIVGGHLPLSAGLGWKIYYREEDNVAVCFFGDGAMNQGATHEAMNLIGLYNLPVILICENNGYGMGTSVDRASAESKLYKRSQAHGIDGTRVNGLDVLEVHEAIGEAVERARDSNQPAFVEAMTYRYRGHSMSDPAEYRSDEEVEEYKEKDPIKLLAEKMKDRGWLSDDRVDEIEEEQDEVVQEAMDFADESPQPDRDEVYEDVYVEYPFHLSNKQ